MEAMNQDEKIGVVQSKILLRDGMTINSAGVQETENLYFQDIGFGEQDSGQYDQVRELDYFSGGSALLRRTCLQDVGDFDEDFMFYAEDLDYSLRCRKKGWKILYCPGSVTYHEFHGSVSQDFCQYFCSRNRLLFIGKHLPLRLPQSIKTSHFYLRQEYDRLRHSLLQAITKMIENSDADVSVKVLKELGDIATDLPGSQMSHELFDYVLTHNGSCSLVTPAEPPRTSVLCSVIRWAAAPVLRLRTSKD
jgi:GT2 family glycosyltransferase